ncbi:MAG: VTT domain-containing protein [Chloroflexota bacterium]
MRHYLLAAGAILAFFLVLFLVGEAAGIPLLEDPTPWLERAGWLSAAIGVSLLAADVLLPIPSNVIMIAHGALFGTVVGTVLSLLGSMLAAGAGFWIGRRGGPLLALAVPPDERARADRFLARWGILAILVSRPLPLLAETITVLAGASALGWRPSMLAALVGSLPPCLFYAWAGAASIGFEGGALVFGGVILLAIAVGLIGRQLERARPAPSESSG